MKMIKNIKKEQNFIKECLEQNKKYIDKFVYVFLAIFMCICICFRLNFLQVSIISIFFSLIIFGFYLGKYKFKLNKGGYKEKIENLTEKETLNLLRFYYEEKGYDVDFESFEPTIRKNNHTYRLFIVLEPIKLNNKDLNYIIFYKENKIDGKVLITNKVLSKEEVKIIKQNGIYTITKEGLINIYQDYLKDIEKQENIKSKEKDINEKQ